MWGFKLGSKSINAKFTDQNWLKKYHQRDFPLLPNDSLKVKLKVSFNTRESDEIHSLYYEFTEVIDVIYHRK